MAATAQQQIRVKSYFASSVPDAIELARKELGGDALLLNCRPSPPEALHLGPLEVVFGDNSPVRSREPERLPAPRLAIQPAGMEDLSRKLEEIRNMIRTGGEPRAAERRRPLETFLIEAGFSRSLASEIEDSVALRVTQRSVTNISRPRGVPDWDEELVIEETAADLNSRIEVRPTLGRATALVGPPGAGKTTALVKLAMREGLMKGRSVRLISADAQRIAASEQLRVYAAILGVAFQSAESHAALAQAVDSAPPGALLLIDTPGLSPALLEGPGSDLANFFRRRQDIDVHLVLTAGARQSDLENAATRFSVFHPSALIFTRLDETDSLGPAFCEAVRTRTPVSFLCDGQLIPENIEPASIHRFTDSLVRQLPQVLRSAA